MRAADGKGYACDCCGAELVRDIELDALRAVLWADQSEHVCLMCLFGVLPESTDEGEAACAQ